jgi:hypothetical protein
VSDRIIDLASPELGRELRKDAKGKLPIDVWRVYVLLHSGFNRRPGIDWHPAPVIHWGDQPHHRATLDPQQAVDEAWKLLMGLLVTTRKCSYHELLKGIWEAQLLLFRAESGGRKRGQPTSMRQAAVRAFIIRKFNPHPTNPKLPTVGLDWITDELFREGDKCPRCRVSEHRYNSDCVKALATAVTRLKTAMKRDGIPTERNPQ